MTMPTHVTLAAATETVDPEARTIRGRIVTFDTRADSTPPCVFARGSIKVPDDPRRVKLLIDHDHGQPVGYGREFAEDETGITATFYVPEGADGDRALAQARDGLRDGLSVGVWPNGPEGADIDRDGLLHMRDGTLRETSLCALPAIDDARVAEVNATQAPTTKETLNMDPIQTPAADVTASTPAPQPPETPDPAPQAPPVLVQAAQRVTLREAATIVADLVRSGQSASEVRAALADVTPASLPGTGGSGMEDPWLRNHFLGELWTASKVERPFIDLLGNPQPINGLKVYGYKWQTKPEVDEYEGNKAEVPTNSPKIVPAEATVERIAGGWDIDRIYVDLGDASLIEALWRMAVEDYRAKTEAAVQAKLVAAATSSGSHDSLAAALASIGETAAAIGASIRGLGLASDVWAAFTTLTRNQVPWWLGSGDSVSLGTASGTVGGTRVFVAPSLAAGSILGVDTRAATFYESNPPVRVNAVDLAKGGVDLGLFGYHALIVNDARAIVSGTVTAPSGGDNGGNGSGSDA